MPDRVNRAQQALSLLQDAHLHPQGPRSAVRAAARLVLAGTVPIPNVELAVRLVHDAASLDIISETVVANAVDALHGHKSSGGGIIVNPCAASAGGHAVPFQAMRSND